MRVAPGWRGRPYVPEARRDGMGRRRVPKGGLAVKAVQVAQRELKKPENQKRINDALAKLRNRHGPVRP